MMDIEGLFQERDFQDLKFKVMNFPSGTDLLKKIPEMAAIEAFATYRTDMDKNKIFKYIVLAYDENSPIYKKFTADERNRKTWAARYAGFEPDKDGLFNADVDDIMKCFNKEVNNLIIEFIRTFNDPEWASLVIWYESYFRKLENLINIQSSDDPIEAARIEEIKGKIQVQTKGIGNDISEVAKRILREANPYLKRDLFCTIDNDIKNRLKITPERMAGIEG